MLKCGPKPKVQLKTLALEPLNKGSPPHFQGAQHSAFSISPRARTTEDLQLPIRKGQALQVSETDSEPVEFRSLDYKEHPITKQK